MRTAVMFGIVLATLGGAATAQDEGTEGERGLLDAYRDLAAARQVQIERLEAYAKGGRFPLNEVVEGRRVPVFIDKAGTACAVGYLMIESGCRKEAEAIAKADNLVRIADVKEGALVEWVQTSGLTQEECALIQPGYEWQHPERQPSIEVARLRKHFKDVVAQLREDTGASLSVALERRLPPLKKQIDAKSAGFVVKSAIAAGKARWTIKNPGSTPVRVRISGMNARGEFEPEKRWQSLSTDGEVISYASGTAIFVEWQTEADVVAAPITIVVDRPEATTVPIIPGF